MRLSFLMPFYGFSDYRKHQVMRDLGRRIAPVPASPPRGWAEERPERLRIGYISSNFGEHPVGHLLAPLFEAHDRRRIELHAYSTVDHSLTGSDYPGRLRAAVENWRDCHGLDDAAVAALIARDRLHVLIDLGGYLGGGCPQVLARRPAPVQMHWIMHLGGMPAPYIDYTIVDRIMVPCPAGSAGPLIRLPHAFRQDTANRSPKRLRCGASPDCRKMGLCSAPSTIR